MDKKVWAILGIVCLQLAAVWFLKGSLLPEELTEASKPAQSYAAKILRNVHSPKPPQITASNQPDIVTVPTLNTFRPHAAHSQVTNTRRTVRTGARRAKTLPPSSYAVNQPKFTDTIIYVKRTEYQPYERLKRTEVSKPIKTPVADIKPKKKTIWSRALPVVKKPYQWMKTLVSKL